MKPTELSSDRGGVFKGDDPFEIARAWLVEAEKTELNDANAGALATVDADGMPNTRVVLLKEIEAAAFVFFTNYNSAKAKELLGARKAAFGLHWKSLRRQVRVRGTVSKMEPGESDKYFLTRSVFSRVGAWASDQSAPLENRAVLEDRVNQLKEELGDDPQRPPHWGGFRIVPTEIEFWCDGAYRVHDRFLWRRESSKTNWQITRLNP